MKIGSRGLALMATFAAMGLVSSCTGFRPNHDGLRSPDVRKVQFTGIPFRRRVLRATIFPAELLFNVPFILANSYQPLYQPERSLYVYDFESRRLTEYSELSHVIGVEGRWSPDSRWITLKHTQLIDGRFQLALVDTEQCRIETKANPHVPKKADIAMISWSPDGSAIFFVQAGKAFAYSPKTDEFRKLPTPDAQIMALIPVENGGYAVATGEREVTLHVYDASGNPRGSFASGISNDGNPIRQSDFKTSPSGRFCAFWRNAKGLLRLHVVDFEKMTCTQRFQTRNFGHVLNRQQFHWSPKGNRIITMFPKYTKRTIRRVDSVLISQATDGKILIIPFTPGELQAPIRYQSWSPDGRRVLLTDVFNSQNVVLIDAEDGMKTRLQWPKERLIPYFDAAGNVAFRKPGPTGQ